MSHTNYPGIDYGMGLANIDPETGIRFGVISANAEGLTEWLWESFEPDYGPASCPICGNETTEYDDDKHGDYQSANGCGGYRSCADYACESCEAYIDSADSFCEEPIGHYLDDGEYCAWVDSHNDIMLTRSPYYTHAQFCSPCAPGAGHLENPCADGPRTYCFGHEWFDGGKAPYSVYRVTDGSLVEPQ